MGEQALATVVIRDVATGQVRERRVRLPNGLDTVEEDGVSCAVARLEIDLLEDERIIRSFGVDGALLETLSQVPGSPSGVDAFVFGE